jgi:hypothetical protein
LHFIHLPSCLEGVPLGLLLEAFERLDDLDDLDLLEAFERLEALDFLEAFDNDFLRERAIFIYFLIYKNTFFYFFFTLF